MRCQAETRGVYITFACKHRLVIGEHLFGGEKFAHRPIICIPLHNVSIPPMNQEQTCRFRSEPIVIRIICLLAYYLFAHVKTKVIRFGLI